MKIFYFTDIRLGKADAGNRHVIHICNALASLGHQVSLFVPRGYRGDQELHSSIKIIGVPVINGISDFSLSLSYYFLLPWVAGYRLATVYPDIVYTRTSYLDWIALIPLKILFGVTYVAELNGIRSLETKGGIFKRAVIALQERMVLKIADKVIGNAPELCQWAQPISGLPDKRITAIGNGVPIDEFVPIKAEEARSELELDKRTRYLTYTSSLRPWHDSETLLRAMPHILRAFPTSIKLLIVGDGPQREQLEDLADQLNIDDKTIWTGRVPASKVPMFINAGEICLAPFPPGRTYFRAIKIYEYMGCGRPIVTTRLNASYDVEIESCGCGVLVPPRDPPALAEAVIELLKNPEHASEMGKRGRSAAEIFYSWDKIGERTAAFLAEGLDTETEKGLAG